jgi:phosphoserine phosphatase
VSSTKVKCGNDTNTEVSILEWPIDMVSGVRLSSRTGTYTGEVDKYFSEHEKITFVRDHANHLGLSLDEVAAIGDSRSDVPLFDAVGMAVALNGDHRAIAAANVSVKANNLCSLLPLLLRDT